MKKDRILTGAVIALTALCWISLCLDWDIAMYVSGFLAIGGIGLMDAKEKDKRAIREDSSGKRAG